MSHLSFEDHAKLIKTRYQVHTWVRVSLLFLLIAAFLGLLLRVWPWQPIPGLNYKFVLHAHSHVMLLGWVFNALFAAIVWVLHPVESHISPRYGILFWSLQFSVGGMLVTFPVMGYALWSIVFSTLHIFLSFYFGFLVLGRTKSLGDQYLYTSKFLRWSIFFLVISALGPFALGLMVSRGLSDSYWYQLSIYYYLHFQYNGWISFALLGLLFWLPEREQPPLPARWSRYFYGLICISCVPAFALSVLWLQPPLWIYVVAATAALLQLVALVVLWLWLYDLKEFFKKNLAPWAMVAVSLALVAFSIKIALQAISAFPEMAELAYKVKNYVIGYLHLVFLGFVTLFLLGWFKHLELLRLQTLISKTGLVLLIIGFIGSELFLVLPPLSGVMGGFQEGLLLFSVVMAFGLLAVSWSEAGNLEK